MKERQILFSGTNVRAILDGRKTQTRRVAPISALDIKHHTDGLVTWGVNFSKPVKGSLASYSGGLFTDTQARSIIGAMFSPYGQPGDRLRVKEAAWMWCERRPNGKTKTGRQKWHYVPMREAPIRYAADHPTKPTIDVVSPDTGNTWGWRLKIGRFLPAWASRITLEITGVRVERLNDISEADARAEGVDWYASEDGFARFAFRRLWESINGTGSWDADLFVWVIEFRRIEQ